MDENRELWNIAAAFHGHVCPGLTIGYKAALYAIELLDIHFADGRIARDEEIVCVSENDACGVDAIQAILSCSVGKGNLLFHMRGKQAFSFYNRGNGKSVRLVLRDKPREMTREESYDYYQGARPDALFDVKEPGVRLPERARIFESFRCACCGESTGANWIRIQNGKKVCLDCFESYDRFDV